MGTIFGTICLLGILAGIFPSSCSRPLHFGRSDDDKSTHPSTSLTSSNPSFRGHHPGCRNFKGHILRFGNKVFCAGCVGLIFGAILSLIGVTFYFFFNLSFWPDYVPAFCIGLACVSCGLLQYQIFNWGNSLIHASVNSLFVCGVFLLLMDVDQSTRNTGADLYLIALSMFWLYTRITLSKVDHRGICAACGLEGCEVSER